MELLSSEDKIVLWSKDFIKIGLINTMLFIGWQMQLTALPLYLSGLSASDTIVGISISVGTFAALIARPLAGYMLDHSGRRGVLIVGMIIMTVMTALYSFFSIAIMILAIRFFHGLGWGASTTSSSTIATDIIPTKRFGEGMGYYTLSQSISLALAPVIGLTIMDYFGFRTTTSVSAILLIVALFVALTLRPRQIEPTQTSKFSPYERAAVRPAITMAFIGMSIGSVNSFAALYGRSLGFNKVSLFFTCFAISMLLIRPLVGYIIDRLGYHVTILPGFIILISSMITMFCASTLFVFLFSGILLGLSYGTLQTSLQTMAFINVTADRRGAANATFWTGFDAGNWLR